MSDSSRAGPASRAVVVGGGIAGAAVALALRDRGAEATVVERALPGRATAASAGMLTPLYEAAEATPLVRLGLRGRERWPAFAGRLERLTRGSVRLRRDGLLVACLDGSQEERSAGAAAALREAGLAAELLDERSARRLEPLVGPARAWLWLPEEGQVDAQALAALLPEALRAAGVRLCRGLGATRLRIDGGAVRGVELAGGPRLDAERVVLAAGAWSGQLGGLPRPLPVRPVRGQMIRFDPGGPLLRRLVADQAGRYVVPRDDGSALAGSTMEEAGFDPGTTEEGLAGVRTAARRLVPALADRPEVDSWAGLRPMAPDEAPILGADPEVRGLFYAAAYGRNGILIAPAAGEAVAALVLDADPGFDLAPFRIDRFE